MIFNVFGTEVEVTRRGGNWEVFYVGDGLKRPAQDIAIPGDIQQSELALYLADIRHEHASASNSEVKCLG